MNHFPDIPDHPSREYLLSIHRQLTASLDQLRTLKLDDPALQITLAVFEAQARQAHELIAEIAVRLATDSLGGVELADKRTIRDLKP
ncbi:MULTISPECIES: hypothetical protein [Pseudomonas]|uniref:hypothetical protein n=1 Tax=Pseudomonas TaxID=286 RepID=UPI00115FC1F9|nr:MULTISPECIES: hypothetical protein [Pseudomonas]NMY91784.1 hypothetical protein [Pseudomonas psychrotolerans]NMY92003.1 hypothetical protein [Pseudomonas psychrotolerans]NRH44436.1 hypothetical protein [Pseudomonas sp. MS15a(2019)]HJE69624.1 hypothetical protein [Pseudomonas oryzihabitans]